MNAARIALRNLSRQKRRSILLGGAVAFGILVITLITSLAAGFMVNVQENFASFLAGHIFVSGFEKSASGRLLEVIRDEAQRMTRLPDFCQRTDANRHPAVRPFAGIAENSTACPSGINLARPPWERASKRHALPAPPIKEKTR